MPLSRSEKTALVERYVQGFATAPHAFLFDFKGVTVPQATELRAKIRECGASCEVVKNTLALRAIQGTSFEGIGGDFEGPTAVAFTHGDPVTLAGVLTEFAKGVPVVEFKSGLLSGQPISAADLDAIAKMPSREELIAKLLFLMQSPVSGLVTVLAALPRDLVVVFDQIKSKKEKAESAS